MKKMFPAAVVAMALAALTTPLFAQTLSLEYSTFLGGSLHDRGKALAFDSVGGIYLVGDTSSADFPVLGAYQSTMNGQYDVYAAKLTSTGSAMIFSTYLGGYGVDNGNDIAVDANRDIYVAGNTASGNFPTLNAYQAAFNPGTSAAYTDAYLFKLSSTGSTLIYSTFLGGDNHDGTSDTTSHGAGLAIDTAGRAYVAGYTRSQNFPVQDAIQFNNASDGPAYDCFVTVFNSDGSSLYYSTYLGGTKDENCHDIAIDGQKRVYITGTTTSTNFPLVNAYQGSNAGSTDIFVARINSIGSAFDYSTYLGTSSLEYAMSIVADGSYCAYICGNTYATAFPTVNPFQASNAGSNDALAIKFSSAGSALLFSTYVGGSGADIAYSLALDSAGRILLTGNSLSIDFPTLNSYQATFSSLTTGDFDAYLVALSPSGSSLAYSTYLGGEDADKGNFVTVDVEGRAFVAGTTQSYEFPTANPFQPSNNSSAGQDEAFFSRFQFTTPVPTPSPIPGTPTPLPTLTPAQTPEPTLTPIVPVPTNTPFVPEPTKTPFSPEPTHTPLLEGTPTPGPVTRNNYHTDFDGDGTSDIVLYRPSTGMWSVRNVTRIYLGNSLDQPVPADYDGDGITDFSIFRGSENLWAVRDITRIYFGVLNDFIRPGDYNGDGAADFGLYRRSQGLWAVKDLTRIYFGGSTDYPVPGFYDDDDVFDLAIYKSDGLWAVRNLTRIYLGASTDNPVPGDYNGDGVFEAAIFRPSNGLWRIRDFTSAYFGGSPSVPFPGDYDGDGADDIGIFRYADGMWSVRNITRVYFGGSSDVPVTR
jgi:hypothetical protein